MCHLKEKYIKFNMSPHQTKNTMEESIKFYKNQQTANSLFNRTIIFVKPNINLAINKIKYSL